jgi:hypothetical protein
MSERFLEGLEKRGGDDRCEWLVRREANRPRVRYAVRFVGRLAARRF